MTSRITSRTPKQEKQLKRFIEDAVERILQEVNPDKDGLQCLFAKGGKYQNYLVDGARRFTAKAPNYDLARTILGKDFISPEEIAQARNLAYTDEHLAFFGDSLPDKASLEWCRDNGMMLVAGPPKPMSLLDVRNVKNDDFYSKEGGWYAENEQEFSRDDKIETKWIAVRKEPIAGSLSKSWSEQRELITDPAIVPNTAETVWALTTYKAVRGVYLLPNHYVRTSSLGSHGYRVCVGSFGAEGLSVDSYWDGVRFDDLGLAAARKF